MINFDRSEFFPILKNINLQNLVEILKDFLIDFRIKNNFQINDISSLKNLRNNSILFIDSSNKNTLEFYDTENICLITNDKTKFENFENNAFFINDLNKSYNTIINLFFHMMIINHMKMNLILLMAPIFLSIHLLIVQY